MLRPLSGGNEISASWFFTAMGQRTHLTLSAYILKPCFAAGLFLSRV